MIDFIQYYFLPVNLPWWEGAIYGNIIATPICGLLAYLLVFRKLIECSKKGCHRFAFHRVEGTHYKTCHKHTTASWHSKLHQDHSEKYPIQHEFINHGHKQV